MTSPTLDRRQGLVGNTPIKAPVDCATTGDITLAGEQLIDGVQTAGSRVMVWRQTDPTENGIYDTSTADWTRALDANGNYDLTTGTIVAVTGGTIYGSIYSSYFFQLVSPKPIVIGTSSLTFVLALFSSSGQIMFLQAGTGAVSQSVEAKLRQFLDFADFGVIYDGNAAATTVGATGTDNTLAVRKAIKDAALLGKSLRITGIARISDEFEILAAGAMISGDGPGTGFGAQPLTGYTMRTGFLVTGGTKRVRTRRKYRASAADPQDDPLSVAINVQAEGVTLRDFCVFLWFDRTDNSPTNYGAACDVGIFNGCRVNLHMDNVHVLGYWRVKSFYQDVTRGTALSEFNDLDGNPYPRGTVTNGADGLVSSRCFFSGGKSGVALWGSTTASGAYAGAYYDQGLGTTVADARGSFGCSDVMFVASEIFATEHHSLRRRNDPSGNYLTDTAGAAVEIDGIAGNASGSLQGITFVGGRIATWEPYRLRLGRANRVKLLGTHIETRSGSGATTTAGVALAFNSTDCYGLVSMESATRNVQIEGMPSSLVSSGFGVYIDAAATYHELWYGSAGNVSTTFHTWACAGLKAQKAGEFPISAFSASDSITFNLGADLAGTLSSGGFIFGASITDPFLQSGNGELDLRSNGTSNVRIRCGSVSEIVVSTTQVTFTAGVLQIGTGGPTFSKGAGSPNGVVTAIPGSIYLNTSGGAGVSFFSKESLTGNTGWIGK